MTPGNRATFRAELFQPGSYWSRGARTYAEAVDTLRAMIRSGAELRRRDPVLHQLLSARIRPIPCRGFRPASAEDRHRCAVCGDPDHRHPSEAWDWECHGCGAKGCLSIGASADNRMGRMVGSGCGACHAPNVYLVARLERPWPAS